MSVHRWVAEGVNSERLVYWFMAHVVKFIIEGALAAVMAGIVLLVVWFLTADVRLAIPALLNLSTGIPYTRAAAPAAAVLLWLAILRYLVWCRLERTVST